MFGQLQEGAVGIGADVDQLGLAGVFAREAAEHHNGGIGELLGLLHTLLGVEGGIRIGQSGHRVGRVAVGIGIGGADGTVSIQKLLVIRKPLSVQCGGQRDPVLRRDYGAARAAAHQQEALIRCGPAKEIYLLLLLNGKKIVLVFQKHHALFPQGLDDLVARLQFGAGAAVVCGISGQRLIDHIRELVE